MAIARILPNATASSYWTNVGEGTAHECLDDSNNDTSYIESGTHGNSVILGLQDLDGADSSDVDNSELLNITQVQAVIVGRVPARSGGDGTVQIVISEGGGTSHTENVTLPNYATHQIVTGTARTTAPSSGVQWTYEDITNLTLTLSKVNNSSPAIRITYAYVAVTYNGGYGHKTGGIKAKKINGINATSIRKVNGLSK